MSLVFFITGASSGFGAFLSLQALSNGHKVIATVRNRQRAANIVTKIDSSSSGRVLELDVTNAAACSAVYKEAEAIHGHIDVLINNAGIACLGAVEDYTDEEHHAQMDVNFYGPARLIRAALPLFRERKSGLIVNITSVAGIDGLPCCGAYAASKFALEGYSESLAREVSEYGIQVLIVEPGAFRTNFLGAFVTNNKAHIDNYSAVKAVLQKFADVKGKQPGDPEKAAARILEFITGEGVAGALKGKVSRLALGSDCLKRIEAKIDNLKADGEAVRDVACSTDY